MSRNIQCKQLGNNNTCNILLKAIFKVLAILKINENNTKKLREGEEGKYTELS